MGPIERATLAAKAARHARFIAAATKAKAAGVVVVPEPDASSQPQPRFGAAVPAMAKNEDSAWCKLFDLLCQVAKTHDVEVPDLRSQSREQILCRARNEFYYRAATETDFTYRAIAKMCRRRDHGSALWGCGNHCIDRGLPLPRGACWDDHRRKKSRGMLRTPPGQIEPPKPNRAPGQNAWTEAELDRARALHAHGLTYRDIDRRLGRPVGCTGAKLRMLEKPPEEQRRIRERIKRHCRDYRSGAKAQQEGASA